MISRRQLLSASGAAAVTGVLPPTRRSNPPSAVIPRSAYDRLILSDRPAAFYSVADASRWYDAVGNGHAGFPRGHGWTTTAVGGRIPVFDGRGQYAVRDHSDIYSPAASPSRAWTLEAWLRPDALTFPRVEQSGYVLWAGKGEKSGSNGDREWAARMYSHPNSEGRWNRASGYVYGPTGGYGAGSFFQDLLSVGGWLHITFVMNLNPSGAFPSGYTAIYRDGMLRGRDSIAMYSGLRPRAGRAKFRIGTRDGASFFAGAIGKVAIYSYELPVQRIQAHVAASGIVP